MPAARTGADALKVGVSPEILYMHAVGTVPGVAIAAAAYRNGPGTGTMRYDPAEGLSWKAVGEEKFGGAVLVGADGDYLLEGDDDRGKFIRVTVATAYLPEKPAEALVHLADRYGMDTDIAIDKSAAQAAGGTDTTFGVQLTNMGRAGMSNLKVWIDSEASVYFELSDGVGGWFRPTTEETARALGFLAVGNQTSFNCRTNLIVATPASARELNWLHFAWESF